MIELLTVPNLIALLTLTALEIVLGIDNIIFIAIQAGNLPVEQRDRARRLGLLLAVVSRVLLLFTIGWVVQLKQPMGTLLGHEFTWKDLVVLAGGLFLIRQATVEIHHKVEGHHAEDGHGSPRVSTLNAMLVQVTIMDVVFSLDSVITAVGMCKEVPIMIAAVLISVGVMLVFSGSIVRFVDQNPAIKLLALSFLLLIGVLLVAEGFHQEIDKGYIYFAMAFSLGIELMQMRSRHNEWKRQKALPADAASSSVPHS
ncbi:MAG: TerC family protein [Planctomycetota bacterium]|nr:TerC family protein [Planctomycetales bacterium]RLS44969.1 MAG: TerC family protein [Planctomycetota bacterium]